ncbi:MAG: ribonuclease III [Thermoanaerobaculia bacterium]|nr:ribonuclease III [Thermoanaerobaculia bacterium]
MTVEDNTQPQRNLEDLEDRLGHRFSDRNLLETAVTHRSWANERGAESHYERLEFLGDSVLGLITAQWLYERFPLETEGDLALRLSYLVSAPVLTRIAEEFGAGAFLRFGVGEERSGGRQKDSLLADTVEALLGALYLDAGLDPARQFILPFFETELEQSAQGAKDSKDAKTSLQERLQAAGSPLPEYRLVGESGPDHEKTFVIECWVGSALLGTGEGPTKKRAQQVSAEVALGALG